MGAFQKVHTMLRKHVGATGTYNLLRRANTFYALKTGTPHEADYCAFPLLAGRSGLFLDIGANAGQTAASVSRLLPRHDIICFEPNPALQSELAWVQSQVGERMRVCPIGLGAGAETVTLHVPTAGKLAFEARASVLRSEAEAHARALEGELGRSVSITETRIDIAALDSLDLAPDLIKIDVEGFEADVLKGAEQTLAAHAPAVMLEQNENSAACRAWLAARGYRFVAFDADAKSFTEELTGALNFFAIPEGRALP